MLINSNKKFMSLKNYQRIRLVIVFFLAMAIAFSITLKNFILPVVLLIVATLIIMGLRRSVKEIIADERDYALAGKSASLAMSIFGWFGVVLMFFFYHQGQNDPVSIAVANTLSYSVLGLFLIYGLVFRVYNYRVAGGKKAGKSLLNEILLMIALALIIALPFIMK